MMRFSLNRIVAEQTFNTQTGMNDGILRIPPFPLEVIVYI